LTSRFLAWEHEGNRALREGKWKLVSLAAAPWELYDMEADREEMNDLSATQPERVKELSAKWESWASRTKVFPRP
jgi:arylsulfatase